MIVFKYNTRTTSENFCSCISNYDFVSYMHNYMESKTDDISSEIKNISSEIKNMSWFTGAMESDPTVKSMLVVLDCIHKQFQAHDNFNYDDAKTLLTSDNCPISFNCLDLNDGLGIDSGIRDLYIKMNTRGLLLTDFELFKADLQKTGVDNTFFDLMGRYLGCNNSESEYERKQVIGKFNCDFTNFFFRVIDNGEIKYGNRADGNWQMFDVAMMNFINEIIRMNYFCTISNLGVATKKYRYHNDVVRKMSGKEFSNFIRTRGSSFNEGEKGEEGYWADKDEVPYNDIEDSLTQSFKEIIDLLNNLWKEYEEKNGLVFDIDGDNKCRILLSEMMKQYAINPQDNNALPNRESVLHMALLEFIHKFGIPHSDNEKAAFIAWSRFVWKIDRSLEFKSFDEAVETLKGYKKILGCCNESTQEDVLKAIVRSGEDLMGGAAKLQYGEEFLKAVLIINNHEWREVIKEAEDYFSSLKNGKGVYVPRERKYDGQIWFLLDLAKENDGYNLDKFKKAFIVSKKVFKGSRELNINSNIFERALLAISVRDNINYDHLNSMGVNTTETKKFVGDDFSNHISHDYCSRENDRNKARYDITLSLLKELLTASSNIYDIENWDIEGLLKKEYIEKTEDNWNNWKCVFIKNDILNEQFNTNLRRDSGFEPGRWDIEDFSYTAVYSTGNRRGRCGELNTFLLGVKLSELHFTGISYELRDLGDEYLNAERNFPTRYLSVNGYDIGYMKGKYWRRENNQISELGDLDTTISTLKAER